MKEFLLDFAGPICAVLVIVLLSLIGCLEVKAQDISPEQIDSIRTELLNEASFLQTLSSLIGTGGVPDTVYMPADTVWRVSWDTLYYPVYDTIYVPAETEWRPIPNRSDMSLSESIRTSDAAGFDVYVQGPDTLTHFINSDNWFAFHGDYVSFQFHSDTVTVPRVYWDLTLSPNFHGQGVNHYMDILALGGSERYYRDNQQEPGADPDPDPDPDPVPPGEIPMTGLIGWWSFENPDNLGEDSFGESDFGVSGDLSQVDGIRGKAVSFPGQGGNYMYNRDLYPVSTGDFTLNVWARPRNIHNQIIANGRYNTEPAVGISFTNASPRLQAGDGVNTFQGQASGSSFIGKWRMYTLVVDRQAQTVTLYVDGEEERVADITGWGPLSTRNRFDIGKTVNSWSGWLDGDIDELAMWSTDLSQAEIRNLFNNGSAVTLP